MSILASVTKPGKRAKMLTVMGDPGSGKTTLGCTFSSPVFLRAEDGVIEQEGVVSPDCLPLVKSFDDVVAQISALINEDHGYKTLVIDSVTALNRLFEDEIIRTDGAKSIIQALGGYNAGFKALAAMHERVCNGCKLLRDKKGMTIVYLAHSDTITIDPPDAESYTKYSLRMNKLSLAPYTDDTDLVGYLKPESVVLKDKHARKGKIKGTGDVYLHCNSDPANETKNRMGIDEPLLVEYGKNPLTKYL